VCASGHVKLNLKAKNEKTNENIAKGMSVDLSAQICCTPVTFSRDGASELIDGGSKTNDTVNFLNGELGNTPVMLVSGNWAVLSLSVLGPNHHQPGRYATGNGLRVFESTGA
jgi:hypothetical protein